MSDKGRGGWICELHSSRCEESLVLEFWEHSNEYPEFIKGSKFIYQMSDCQLFMEYIVTCIPIARQRLSRNNRTSIATQRSYKHVSLTIEDYVFRGVRPEAI
jgi:hypothetical protein